MTRDDAISSTVYIFLRAYPQVPEIASYSVTTGRKGSRTPRPDLPHYRGAGSDTREPIAGYGIADGARDVVLVLGIAVALLALIPFFLFGLMLGIVRPPDPVSESR